MILLKDIFHLLELNITIALRPTFRYVDYEVVAHAKLNVDAPVYQESSVFELVVSRHSPRQNTNSNTKELLLQIARLSRYTLRF